MPNKDLESIQADSIAPDALATTAYEEERGYLDNELRQAEIDDLVQDRDQRKQYAKNLFLLMVWWLIIVGGIVISNGAKGVPFKLSDFVLNTLIGTSTASILGLFAIVAKYLFHRR